MEKTPFLGGWVARLDTLFPTGEDLATLMKYGDVREEDKEGSYFRYGLVADRSSEPGPRPGSG